MHPENVHNTEADAYAMGVTVALRTLEEIMTDKNEATNYRIWAAESVLENNPVQDKEPSESSKEE